jgi:hypothetical protein
MRRTARAVDCVAIRARVAVTPEAWGHHKRCAVELVDSVGVAGPALHASQHVPFEESPMLRLLSSTAVSCFVALAVAACSSTTPTDLTTTDVVVDNAPSNLSLLDAPGTPEGEGTPTVVDAGVDAGVQDKACKWKCQCEAPAFVFKGTSCQPCQDLIDGINAVQGCGATAQPRWLCNVGTGQVSCIVRCADLNPTTTTAATCAGCALRAGAACQAQTCKLGLLGNGNREVVRESSCGG